MIEFTEEPQSPLEIYTFMCRRGGDLRSDKDFKEGIKITHLDGSEFHLENCSWDQDEKRIYIWTEHCGYFYFYKEDVDEMEITEYEWSEERSGLNIHKYKITVIQFTEVEPNEDEDS